MLHRDVSNLSHVVLKYSCYAETCLNVIKVWCIQTMSTQITVILVFQNSSPNTSNLSSDPDMNFTAEISPIPSASC